MINQIYIESAGSNILCVIKTISSFSEISGVIMLLPGFSQSMCDTDYFMTNLSNKLINKGYATIQIDLYGHGDSYGDFSETNLSIIESNILAVFEYIKKRCYNKSVIVISRGLYANVISIESIANMFDRVIIINPVVVCENKLDINKNIINDVIEINDILYSNKVFENLFVLLGAETTNIRGQKINLIFLNEILIFINNFTCPHNAIVISTYNYNANIEMKKFFFSQKEKIEYLSTRCFLRDHEWQSKLINQVLECVIKGV